MRLMLLVLYKKVSMFILPECEVLYMKQYEAVARKLVELGLQNTLDTDLRQENEAKSGGYHDYYIKS